MATAQDGNTAARIEAAVRHLLSTNRSPDGTTPRYTVSVRNFDGETASFELHLGFVEGETYCCFEPGCHFGFFDDSWFARLREHLSAENSRVAHPMTLRRVSVTVPEGVRHPSWTSRDTTVRTTKRSTYSLGPFHEVAADD